jgi:hypothetical protein
MTAETPTFDLSECIHFIAGWCEITGAPHVTLTAIAPNGPTYTVTFAAGDLERAEAWIGTQQGAGWNIYFQPNETPDSCGKKPTKAAMQAALCRHADIDPQEGNGVSYQAERERLHSLADVLKADELMPPTVIIDSGNGIQPLWGVERQPLTPEIIEQVENENKAIEQTMGALGTHNIDRLLRLPGTLNFPNAKKRKRGRGVTRARLLYAGPSVYSAGQAAMLGEHLAKRLAGSALVKREASQARSPSTGEDQDKPSKRDRSRIAMHIGYEIQRDGGTLEDLIEALRTNPNTAEWFEEKGKRSDMREVHRIWQKTKLEQPKDGRPIICNTPGRLHLIATQAESALLQAGVPVFQRGIDLVRPIISEVAASHGRTTIAARLGVLNFHSLLDLMSRTANWRRWDIRTESWVNDNPSEKAAHFVLSRAGDWTFPRIAGVITRPTLRPDGSLLTAPGYDLATRLYHAKDTSINLQSLRDEPTRDDALKALELLNGLLTEFPFVGPVDHAVALSGMITPVVRGAITVAPLTAIKATTAGTGKSYLVDIVSAIATGRICPAAKASEKDPVETEKQLVGLLLKGSPIISLDNVNGELGGNLLCQAVERPLVQVRKLGASDSYEIESRATLFATGNALRVTGDMVRRTIACTLDAKMERPELRQFKGDPVARVMDDRGRYIAACLTIVLAYKQAGCPNTLPALASFEDWSRFVRSALVWLDCADPCTSIEKSREDDPELCALRELLGLWSNIIGVGMENARTVRSVAELATDNPFEGTLADLDKVIAAQGDLRDALLRIAGAGGTINTRRLGKWLADHEGRIAGNLKFKRHPTPDQTGVVRWAVVKSE